MSTNENQEAQPPLFYKDAKQAIAEMKPGDACTISFPDPQALLNPKAATLRDLQATITREVDGSFALEHNYPFGKALFDTLGLSNGSPQTLHALDEAKVQAVLSQMNKLASNALPYDNLDRWKSEKMLRNLNVGASVRITYDGDCVATVERTAENRYAMTVDAPCVKKLGQTFHDHTGTGPKDDERVLEMMKSFNGPQTERALEILDIIVKKSLAPEVTVKGGGSAARLVNRSPGIGAA